MIKNSTAKDFWAGFRSILPLWLGAVPFGLAYVVAARKAGLTPLEIQLMSLIIFSSAAQISMVGLLTAGASVWAIVLASLTLNVQNVLYGFSLRQRLHFNWFTRLLATYLLTDGAFVMTMAAGESASVAFLIGAELSMFFIWNASTFGGLLINQAIDPVKLGFDFAIPLIFLVLIVPMIRTRFDLIVLVVAVGSATVSGLLFPGGLTVLITALITAAFGAKFASREPRKEVQA